MEQHGASRRQSKIATDDPEFSVRLASIDELQRILHEAKNSGWSATWTSEEALVQQVEPGSMAVLCPLFRNGGPIDEPNSYRCHVWFMSKGGTEGGVVSLLDVDESSFFALREASEPLQLKKVLRVLLDGTQMGRLE